MRRESVSAVADNLSSTVAIDLRSILSMRSFTFGTDLPFGMNVRMRNAWLYHGGGARAAKGGNRHRRQMPTKVSSPSLTAETGFAACRLGHAAEP